MKNVFLIENNNYDANLGDQIISKQLADTLAQFGDVYILGSPKEYHRYSQFRYDLSKTRWLRAVGGVFSKRYYHVLPAGGWGRINNSEQKRTESNRPRRRYPLVQQLRNKIELRKLVLGVNIDIEPDDPVFDEYYWLGVRDTASLNSLRRRAAVKAGYFPDLCFFETNNSAITEPAQQFAVSFRRTAPGLATTFHDELVRFVVGALADSPVSPDRVVFYHQVGEDREFVSELARSAGFGATRTEKIDLSNYQSFYRGVEFVVSNRLHCLLLGAVFGAVPIAMTFREHDKVISLFETVGWEKLIIDLNDSRSVCDRLHQIMRDRAAHQETVRRTCLEQKSFGLEVLRQLLQRV